MVMLLMESSASEVVPQKKPAKIIFVVGFLCYISCLVFLKFE